MKIVLAIGLVALVSACASAPRYTAEPDVQQKLTVECVASNAFKSGCRTEHEIAIVTTLRPDTASMPSVADLRTGRPEPETY